MADSPITESKFFHYVATAMSIVIIGLMGWIGINVADIPVIKNQVQTLATAISGDGWVAKKLDDHEGRLRTLEQHK